MVDERSIQGNDAIRPLRVREFFLGRQPILDRDQRLIGYELLFRNAEVGPANIVTDLAATASVIAHASQLGVEKVIGSGVGFVNVDAAVLMSDIFQFLPREKLVLEIVETVRATPEVVERIAELVQAGFRFALDDVIADTDDVRKLLPYVEFVKLDLRDMPLSALLKLAPHFKDMDKKLLAEKVETHEEYKLCQDLGFDYFQGYYFAKPAILSGRKLSPSQMAIVQLMKMVTSDATNAEIEAAIKRDVSLGLNLLRLVNAAAVGMPQRIESLSQALMVLGRRQLQRWLQIMLYAEPCKKGRSMTPLLMLATGRGRLMELLSHKLRPAQPQIADIAFTVGIMSLMDALFDMPMAEILQQIAVVDEVGDALLHRRGFLGELLHLVEYLDRIEQTTPQLVESLHALHLDSDDLVDMEMAAYEWSDNVCRSAV